MILKYNIRSGLFCDDCHLFPFLQSMWFLNNYLLIFQQPIITVLRQSLPITHDTIENKGNLKQIHEGWTTPVIQTQCRVDSAPITAPAMVI